MSTTVFPGVRIVDMPDLGSVTDNSSVVGEHAGSGRFSAPALRAYMTSGAVAFVTTIAALRALASGAASVFVQGYYAAGDGGGGSYIIGAAGTDNGGSVIVAGYGTYYLQTHGAPFSVKQFGARGTGTGDDAAAIQAALDAGGAGSKVWCPDGLYPIGSTIVLRYNASALRGSGAGGNHDAGGSINAPCRFIWVGAAGGAMVTVISDSGVQCLEEVEFGGIYLDGNENLAAYGFDALSTRLGDYSVVGRRCSTSLVVCNIDTRLAEPAGFTTNKFRRIEGYQDIAGSGSLLTLNGSTSWNCSQNIYEMVIGAFLNAPAINVVNADSEQFLMVKPYRTAGGTAAGIVLRGGAAGNQTARNNIFYYVGVNNASGTVVPAYAEGTDAQAFPAIENNILFLDTANNPTSPSYGTNATLWWGTLRAPVGFRSFSATANAEQSINAGGLIRQAGLTGIVAPGGTVNVTLPLPFGSGASAVSVAPDQPVPWSATSSATVLTIVNGGTVGCDFRWAVEGR